MKDVQESKKNLASLTVRLGSSNIPCLIPPSSLVYPYKLRNELFKAGCRLLEDSNILSASPNVALGLLVINFAKLLQQR